MSYGVGLRNGVAFALGTIPSLTSGGGLRPSLMLDFLSGSLDPRITFSRGTQAMQYGSDGTLQYAPNNLLTYSNQADNAAWTKSNSFVQQNLLLWSEDFTNALWLKGQAGVGFVPVVTANQGIAPDGTLTADRVDFNCVGATNTDRSYMFQTVTSTSGVPYASSYYIKAFDTASVGKTIRYTIETGASSQQVIITLTADWQRVSNIFPAAGAGYNAILETRGTVTSSATASVLLWGAQVVQGSVPGNYQATTSAALPCLYADYNGALRARKLCENNVAAPHATYQAYTYAANATFCISVYAKQAERSWMYIGADTAAAEAVFFDLANGVVGAQGTGYVGSILEIGSGWYRCTVVITQATALPPNFFVIGATNANGTASYTGDGSSGIYIADAQLTPGYLPLAVTETTSAAVYGPRFDYNPNSLVAQNLLLWSQTFSNVNWTKQTGTTVTGVKAIAPDGTLTAYQINWASTATGQGIFQATGAVVGTGNNTKSIYVRADVAGGTVELADPTGTVGTPAFTLTTSWQRISLTEIQVGGVAGIWLRKTASSPTTIYVWGSQLNKGSTALPYTATTTAPYTLCAARGLLMEEQRTNGIRNNTAQGAVAGTPGTFPTNWLGYLNGITGVAFSVIGTGVEQGINYVDIRMNGTPSATVPQGLQIAFDTNNAIAASASQTWTESLWFKIVGGSSTNISGFFINVQQYNLGAYVIENNVAFTPTSTLTRYSGTVTFTAATTTHALPIIGLGVTSGAPIDITIRIGLPQLELGSFVTSVIPTASAAATRNFDNADITSISSWFNASQGTLYGQTLLDHLLPLSGSGAFPGIFHIADGTFNNRIVLTAYNPSATNNYYGTVITGGVDQGSLGTNSFAANTVVKGAFAYETNNSAFSANNSVAVVDTSVSLPTGLNIANLGGTLSTGANRLNGWLQVLKYYPTRLPNTSLQSITA